MKKLSYNLKKIRKENNLSQEQLAEKLGVSRQSVSKWESDLAYPEMDKMIKLCQIFNLNIDDLLNQDINEISNNKESKQTINKYIDDFLDFITKIVDMFQSMNFKSKIKCILEQVILTLIIIFVFTVLGLILSNICYSIFSLLPYNIYIVLYRIFKSLYLLISLVLTIILVLHIFKVRYLDYYIIVKDEIEKDCKKEDIPITNKTIEKEEKNIENKIILETKKEKIIIRDKKHSTYNFITGLLKCLISLFKLVVCLISAVFILSLIILFILLVLSFLIFETNKLFIGTIILIMSLIVINIIILIIFYNFIISKKIKKNVIAIVFVLAVMLTGTGIGIILLDIPSFEVINDIKNNHFIKEETILKMTDNLYIENYGYDIEYIETNDKDIKIEYIYHPLFNVEINNTNNGIYLSHYIEDSNLNNVFKTILNDIKDKEIISYDMFKINVYSTKENIDKLKDNLINYYSYERQIEDTINNYEQKINELEEDIQIKENEIYNLKDIIEDKENIIKELEEKDYIE